MPRPTDGHTKTDTKSSVLIRLKLNRNRDSLLPLLNFIIFYYSLSCIQIWFQLIKSSICTNFLLLLLSITVTKSTSAF